MLLGNYKQLDNRGATWRRQRAPQYHITPLLHYSITPLLHYSITPLLQHSITPLRR